MTIQEDKQKFAIALSAVAGILAFALLRKVGRQGLVSAITAGTTAATAAFKALAPDQKPVHEPVTQ